MTELKGRFANYFYGDREAKTIDRTHRMSLNAVRRDFGTWATTELLRHKELTLSNNQWLVLELLPDENTADELRKKEIVKALYQDLKESYSSLTLDWLTQEADRLIAGGQPSGGPSMFLNSYLTKVGLIEEGKEG